MTDKPRTWSVEKQWSGVQLAVGPDTEIHSDVKTIELEPVLDLLEPLVNANQEERVWVQRFMEAKARGVALLREHGRLK